MNNIGNMPTVRFRVAKPYGFVTLNHTLGIVSWFKGSENVWERMDKVFNAQTRKPRIELIERILFFLT